MNLQNTEITVYACVASTQDIASERLLVGENPNAIFAHDQTSGRGRLQRQWQSQKGDSLTMSVLLHAYVNHPQPWLIGMSSSIAIAELLDCQLQWPNDLVINRKKVGGILTELMPTRRGHKIPVVGIGINLNQNEFAPEIAHRATSIFRERNQKIEPLALAEQLMLALQSAPEPSSWADLQDRWMQRDDTFGKNFQLTTGEFALATSIGPNGELEVHLNNETKLVTAADGWAVEELLAAN
jgi:BirA family biotin operon repressor/biotin-[acetyl-CoA-carboxylase] ligase